MSGGDVIPSRLFDRDAADYDGLRRALIPCFDAFYRAALDVIRLWHRGGAIRVLDLGAGTGLLSHMIRERFPDAGFHLVDGSPAMMERARRRFEGVRNVAFQVADLETVDLQGPWDLIVSALAIHHLEDRAKRALLARMNASLLPGGLFVNAEQVLGPTPALEALYAARWLDEVRAAGVPESEITKALERMAHDRCATAEDQVAWMREAGLVDVDCVFKCWRFAVLSGKRSERTDASVLPLCRPSDA